MDSICYSLNLSAYFIIICLTAIQLTWIKHLHKFGCQACHVLNEARILQAASDIKCSRIKEEQYGRKSSILTQTVKQCRDWFRTRFGLTYFAANYSHSKKYFKTNWMCRCGSDREEESHIVSGNCEVYGDLRLQFCRTKALSSISRQS